jgi:hypothetical protein
MVQPPRVHKNDDGVKEGERREGREAKERLEEQKEQK